MTDERKDRWNADGRMNGKMEMMDKRQRLEISIKG